MKIKFFEIQFFIPALPWQLLPIKLPGHWHWLPTGVGTHTPAFKQGLVAPQPGTPVPGEALHNH